ncbi:hypothetical protein MPH_13650 [Macrophomina phaseolina MS6]|uniref:Uncharacterized protein n=1 Tax=Macrophomina phaseolina (strain MS6) TaxID=1126212 RepID=K2QHR2_MACPH|nr:hypothetical protein MPH_13650 [Macrophomina phaseolina MS6]
MSDAERKPSVDDHHLIEKTTMAGLKRKADHAVESTVVNHEDAAMPTAENALSSVLTGGRLSTAMNRDAEPRDTTQMPGRRAKAAGAQMIDAISEAAEAVVDTARQVKSVISESAVKTGKKLDEKADSSLGPYGSPGTCVPSDLDPLAEAVHAGLNLEGCEPTDSEDDEQGRESCAGGGAREGKDKEQ